MGRRDGWGSGFSCFRGEISGASAVEIVSQARSEAATREPNEREIGVTHHSCEKRMMKKSSELDEWAREAGGREGRGGDSGELAVNIGQNGGDGGRGFGIAAIHFKTVCVIKRVNGFDRIAGDVDVERVCVFVDVRIVEGHTVMYHGSEVVVRIKIRRERGRPLFRFEMERGRLRRVFGTGAFLLVGALLPFQIEFFCSHLSD